MWCLRGAGTAAVLHLCCGDFSLQFGGNDFKIREVCEHFPAQDEQGFILLGEAQGPKQQGLKKQWEWERGK